MFTCINANTNLVNACQCRYATESINIACKWGYKGVESGDTLTGILTHENTTVYTHMISNFDPIPW